MKLDIPRHKGEPAKAYKARVIYLSLGPLRSLHLCRCYGGKGQLTDWAKRWEWAKSAQQWDMAVIKTWCAAELDDKRRTASPAGSGEAQAD
jgi:hypothetical protein